MAQRFYLRLQKDPENVWVMPKPNESYPDFVAVDMNSNYSEIDEKLEYIIENQDWLANYQYSERYTFDGNRKSQNTRIGEDMTTVTQTHEGTSIIQASAMLSKTAQHISSFHVKIKHGYEENNKIFGVIGFAPL